MRGFVMAGLAAVMVSACSSDSARTPVQPDTISVPLRVTSTQLEPAKHKGTPHNHSVHLSGDQENLAVAPGAPHPSDSHAQGQAIFHIADNDLSFDYKLIVSNIENITQAHIHCGASDVNGPIVVWLYPTPTSTAALAGGAGRHNGVLVEGTILSGATLHVRPTHTPPALPPATCPGGVLTLGDVLERIREGNAYVNVHTNDGVPPTNQGPGDFPGGEVRGQF
jgi:hypothetical protein